ncbi:MAG: glycosyltransferase [Alphaproteobacteria bacterium]
MANERPTAAAFVRRVLAEAAVFDDVRMLAILDRASTDGTRAALEEVAREEPRLTVVWAPENRGVVDAYVRGYREALATGMPWILEIDAGFSHDPADIAGFLPRMREGWDCIYGSRFCPGGRISDSGFGRRVVSWGGTKLTNLLIGTRLADMTSGFQMFRRDALARILETGIRSRGPFFQTEMKVYSRRMRVVEVPIHYRAASHAVGRAAIADSLRQLGGLFRRRIAGTL